MDGPPYFSDSEEIALSYDELNVLFYVDFIKDCRLGTQGH